MLSVRCPVCLSVCLSVCSVRALWPNGWTDHEIGIHTPLKSANYSRFVSQTIGIDMTTFLSRMQNLVKIGKELLTQYLIETKSGICTSLKSDFYFRFHSPLNTKSALPNFICTWDLVLIC